MKNDIQVIEFEKEFPMLNLDFKKEKGEIYDYLIMTLYAEELEKGFKVKKIYKTTKKGTRVQYEVIKSKKDLEEYENFLEEKVKEYNKTHIRKIMFSKED